MKSVLADNISVVMMITNEEYWIDYVLTPLVRSGLPIFIGDCGSTDRTLDIVRSHMESTSQIRLVEYENITPEENGKVRENLAHMTDRDWVFQVDGDEINIFSGIKILLDVDMENYRGGFVTHQNVVWKDDTFRLGNKTSHRRIHLRDAVWIRQYPFETTLQAQDNSTFKYLQGFFGYHMRFLRRSNDDDATYKRMLKLPRYKVVQDHGRVDIFGSLGSPRYPNPYYQEAV